MKTLLFLIPGLFVFSNFSLANPANYFLPTEDDKGWMELRKHYGPSDKEKMKQAARNILGNSALKKECSANLKRTKKKKEK